MSTGPLPNPPLPALLVVDHSLGCPIQKCPACLQWTATGFGLLDFCFFTFVNIYDISLVSQQHVNEQAKLDTKIHDVYYLCLLAFRWPAFLLAFPFGLVFIIGGF